MKNATRFQVSARHLTLASPVFRELLTSDLREGIAFRPGGAVEIVTKGWDAEAFLQLLRILHAQHHLLPRAATVENLAKIIILAEYYGCKECVQSWAQSWIGELRLNFDPSMYYHIFPWIWISWSFKLPDVFHQMTKLAMTTSEGQIGNPGLPIPQPIFGKPSVCCCKCPSYRF